MVGLRIELFDEEVELGVGLGDMEAFETKVLLEDEVKDLCFVVVQRSEFLSCDFWREDRTFGSAPSERFDLSALLRLGLDRLEG